MSTPKTLLSIPTATKPVNATVSVPGSKSITNRALLLAALASGTSILKGALFSEDTEIFADCLNKLGIKVSGDKAAEEFTVEGLGGTLPNSSAQFFVGNAGTAARFIPALVSLRSGSYSFDGVPAMRKRPMQEMLDLLVSLGASVDYHGEAGYMPFSLHTSPLEGGSMTIRADRTSQQLTALLMVAPYAASDTEIKLSGELVSKPYLVTTTEMMRQWGAGAQEKGGSYSVAAGGRYVAQTYQVEPDASSASYFFAAAAATGGSIRVKNVTRQSLQGDARLVDVLEAMGCKVRHEADYTELSRDGELRGGEFDMNDISDTVPTLAAIAPFASTPVVIRNAEHIRWKETDRIKACVNELRKLGVSVDEHRDGMTIYPSKPVAADIETYKDHRIAMSFSVTGLLTPGLRIIDPSCTAKTFPDFFERFFAMLN